MASRFTRFLPEERGKLPELTDDEIALREIANGVRQFKRMVDLIRAELASGNAFRLNPAVVTEFNALALDGLDPFPGAFRTESVEILGSRHRPPPWQDIPALIDECCEYLANNWTTATSIHLAAYAMWRINWIHPFVNGNGRTS